MSPLAAVRRPLLLLVLFSALLTPGAHAAHADAAGPSLEQILAAPFPTELLASPSGGKLAWVMNVRGARNLWVAEPPEYKGRQVTHFDKDDGQTIGGLEWTPDASAIFYVRGGGPNRQGEIPNPTSDPAGAEQAVWRVEIKEGGGEPVKIGLGGSVAVSPKGDGFALGRGGKIFWGTLDGKGELTPLLQARGTARDLRWSPDGGRLAFVSDRGDHAFLGVYDRTAKTLRWIAPSVDKDGEPAWSPDGNRIAFLRIPASSSVTLFLSDLAGQPWSILVADLSTTATGTVKTAWQAREGAGSRFREVVAANQIFWGADDRLIFPWEGDGWLHLYSVPARGGEAALLTPGDFEVENVILSPDRREVIFNSNQGDIDRRHLWRVAVAGGTPKAVTQGTGIEWMPAMTSDGKALAWFQTGARRPAEPVIRLGDKAGARPLAAESIPASFPADALVEPEAVIFNAADGMPIHAQLFKPRGIPPGAPGERRPALLFFHGGSQRQMLLGWSYLQYYYNAYAMNQYLASRGYIVLSVNYRSGIGYGLAFREALRQGAGGATEFNDVLGAGLWLRARPDVDPARIGLWGGSYGGYLTALGLARASDLFAAGVDLHGVHDWNVGIKTFIPSYDPQPDAERLALESSPMAWLEGWRSPVLVIHGDDDRNVAFSQTVTLVEALRKRGVEVEQLIFPDEVHSFLTWGHWLDAYRATADFFDRKLAARGKTLTVRGRRIRRWLGGLAVVAVVLAVWAFWLEPAALVVRESRLAPPGWPAECGGTRVALLADLHIGSPFTGLDKLDQIVRRTQEARPDLILLAGDFVIQGVKGGRFVPPEATAAALGKLTAPLGVYAVLGNHDWWLDPVRVRRAFESAGIPVLDDQARELSRGICRFWLAGVSDFWEGRHDVAGTLARVPTGAPVLVFTHNPDVFVDIPPRVSLTLAGHTHGGQVYIPFVGRLIVPSRYGERFAIGHIVEGGRHLFVTPGLGTSIIPVRFLVPPEISVLTLEGS